MGQEAGWGGLWSCSERLGPPELLCWKALHAWGTRIRLGAGPLGGAGGLRTDQVQGPCTLAHELVGQLVAHCLAQKPLALHFVAGLKHHGFFCQKVDSQLLLKDVDVGPHRGDLPVAAVG